MPPTLFFTISYLKHVFADFLRSSTIFVAGIVAFFIESIDTFIADAWAALVVSFTIFISCIPLIIGIVRTAKEIITLKKLLLRRRE